MLTGEKVTIKMAGKLPIMDWKSPNIPQTFKLFRQKMELYYIVKKCTEQEKFANLLLGVGDPGIEKYNSFV